MANIAVTLPHREAYGALELKENIRKHTYRALIISISSLLVLLLIYTILANRDTTVPMAPVIPMNRIALENINNDDEKADMNAPEEVQTTINAGPAARAGNPVPVPDSEITPDMQEFAPQDVMDRAGAKGGSGIDDGGFAEGITFGDAKVNTEVIEKIPDVGTFIPVEEQPKPSDYAALKKSVVYPDIAKRAGIEGKVIVAVWIDKNGKAKKAKIIDSPNSVLDQAAIDAVMGYNGYIPAIQNKQPVGCWLQLPINFSLR